MEHQLDEDDQRCSRCLLRSEHCQCAPMKVKRPMRSPPIRRSGKSSARTIQGVTHEHSNG